MDAEFVDVDGMRGSWSVVLSDEAKLVALSDLDLAVADGGVLEVEVPEAHIIDRGKYRGGKRCCRRDGDRKGDDQARPPHTA